MRQICDLQYLLKVVSWYLVAFKPRNPLLSIFTRSVNIKSVLSDLNTYGHKAGSIGSPVHSAVLQPHMFVKCSISLSSSICTKPSPSSKTRMPFSLQSSMPLDVILIAARCRIHFTATSREAEIQRPGRSVAGIAALFGHEHVNDPAEGPV